ncbi:MAG: tape measure protein [Flavobacteriales bacterium]|nr:tape measure protein [Flavobacteriales bacterium]
MADNQKLHVDIIGDSSKLNQALGRAEGRLKKFSGSLSRTGRALTTRLTLPLAAVGTMAVKQAANFEKLQTTLNVLTGSAEEGARAFERLVQFSAKTPFQLADLTKVNNTLMGFGLTTDEAFDSLSMLGDVAGIVGGDLQSIAIAFGQAAAEGRVMTRDLRQFINNGVPILQVLSEEMGVAEGAIMDMASEGKITFELLDRAFKNATAEGGKFEGGMETLSGTLNGLFSTLKDNVNIALAELGQEIADALNLQEGIPALSREIGLAVQNFKNLSQETKKFILALAGFSTVAGPIIIFLGAVLGGLQKIGNAFSRLGKLLGAARGGIITLFLSFSLAFNEMFKAAQKMPTAQMGRFGEMMYGPKTQRDIEKTTGLLDDLQTTINGISSAPLTAVGPLLPGQQRDLSSMLFPNIGKTTNNAVEGLTKVSSVLEITKQGITSMADSTIEASKVILTSIQPMFSNFELFGAQILPQVGQALADSFASIADGEAPLKRLITTIKALVVRLMAAAAAALVLSVLLGGTSIGKALGGFSGIFGKLTNFKIGGAIKTGASGFMGMAQGGLAFGQTPVMVGDYSGVRSNPEVIAPLNKLKAMIGGGSQNVSGEFVLRGQDLVVALQRAERNRNRFK